MDSKSDPDSTLPEALRSRFHILSELARTNSSVVYAAQESLLDRKIALKILRQSTKQQAERFVREARALAALKHPNIVQLYSFGCQEDVVRGEELLFLSMELLEGKTLEQFLSAGPLDNTQLQEIFIPVIEALSFAHSAKIIHKDIKPANIMISELDASSRVVKLLDFGISKQILEDSGQLTTSTTFVGTPKYMSPEQCVGKACTALSDVYSLSAVLYEAIAGKPPFAGETAAELMYKHINQEPPAIEINAAERRISKELVYAVILGLSKDPAVRPQSMEQFKSLFLAGLESENYASRLRIPRLTLNYLLLALLSIFALSFACLFLAKKPVRVKIEDTLTELDRDKRKGADVIREDCRLLRAKGRFEESCQRLLAVINDRSRHLDAGVRYCLRDEIAKSYDGMREPKKAEQYWREALEDMPWDMADQYSIVMDRICQVMVADGRVNEAASWCDREMKKADRNNERLLADFKSIKARAIMGEPGRKQESLELLKQALQVYDSGADGRSSKIAMGAGKDIFTLAKATGDQELAERELEKTKNDIMHLEAPEGGAVWNALNLSYFMENNNRIADAISLRKRCIELAKLEKQGTREIPNWQADIDAFEKQLAGRN